MKSVRLVLLVLAAYGSLWAQEGGKAFAAAGTELQIRLRQAVSSYSSKAGTPITALVIAPVEREGKVVIPMGSTLSGYVREARRVGLGFSRETALLHLEFDRIVLPGQEGREIAGRVSRLDDARERVDPEGRIRGIRATDSFAAKISGYAMAATAFDPMALLFGLAASQSVFRLPDSSVVLPAGTEMLFRLEKDLPVEGVFGEPYPRQKREAASVAQLEKIVEALPFRTATQTDGTPSDLTSLLYVGSREAVERAFAAAGWVRADQLDGRSTYGVMRSIIENQGYRSAPMSMLVLAGQEPELTYAKTLNTFFSRHHLRIYGQKQQWEGRPLWTSTATYDSGIGFSRGAKTFIHLINENIDEERSKVINDLTLTGCVAGLSYIERPWVPRDAKNSTGDTLRTDGRIAVLEMNECEKPSRASEAEAMGTTQGLRQSAYLRPIRSTTLTLRNDLLRGSIPYQIFNGIQMAREYFRKPADEAVKSFRYGGQEFLIVEGAKPQRHAAVPKDAGHRVKMRGEEISPRRYEHQLSFSLSGGLSGFGGGTETLLPMTLFVRTAGGVVRDPLAFRSSFERGWTLSPKVTLHSWRYVSNEFAYTRTQTNFRLVGRDEVVGAVSDSRSKAAIRTFTYNTLLHLRPKGSRVRPYLAGGPAFQLIHLLDAEPSQSRLLKFAARDAALFLTAYNFGSKPALEGGGVFQAGLTYGGGVHWHVTPRLFLRADFRETMTRKPDLWKTLPEKLKRETDSETLRLEYAPIERTGVLRHQVVTMGIGVAF